MDSQRPLSIEKHPHKSKLKPAKHKRKNHWEALKARRRAEIRRLQADLQKLTKPTEILEQKVKEKDTNCTCVCKNKGQKKATLCLPEEAIEEFSDGDIDWE